MTNAFDDDKAEIAELEKQQAAAGQGPGGNGQPAQEQQAEQQEPKQAQEQAQPERNDDEIEVENQGRFIRASAFKAAEERRKDAEKRAQEVEAKYAADMARVTERLAMLVENRQQPAEHRAPEPQIPDINTDPLGHFQAKSALLEKQLGELNDWRKGQEKTTEQQTALQRVGEEVTRLEAEFTRQTPDYGDAMAHLRNTWIAEAKVAGVPEHVAIRARAMEIAQLASRSNRNPAELGYELAKARGYAKKAPGQQNGNGQQSSGPTLETLQRGLATAKSTSAAPGRAAPGTPTLEALLQMDDDEFVKNYVGRDNPKWRKIAGGYAH